MGSARIYEAENGTLYFAGGCCGPGWIMPRPSQYVEVRLPDGWRRGVLIWWQEMPEGQWYGKVRPLDIEPIRFAPADIREDTTPPRPPGRGTRTRRR
jgi:hypothetical protein